MFPPLFFGFIICFGLHSFICLCLCFIERLPLLAATTPTTTATSMPAAVAAISPTTPGATPAASAVPTASAAAALGELRCYRCGRRMSTVFYDHTSVCFGLWVAVPTFVERSCFAF